MATKKPTKPKPAASPSRPPIDPNIQALLDRTALILANQSTGLANQEKILLNQGTILANQTKILAGQKILLDEMKQIIVRLVALCADIHLLLKWVKESLLCCEKNTAILKQIFDLVSPSSMTVTFSNSQGDFMGSSATLPVGGTANATAHEWSGLNGTGVELPLAGAISWVSSDPTIATVDPTSGLVTAVAAGTATITATDAANGLTGSGVVSDTPLTAQSLTVDIAPNAGAVAAPKK